MPLVAEPMGDPRYEVRMEAASWLCRRGSPRGVEAVLEERGPLTVLNALRRPEIWGKLVKVRPSRRIRGKPEERPREFARQSGL